MNKEIIVYYGMNHFVNLAAPRFENPHPLNAHCLKGKKEEDYSYQTCPSFHTFIKNVFVLKSPYTYNFDIKGREVTSDLYDQKFFNDHITIRSINSQLFSLLPHLTFFTEEEDLNMSLEHPWFDDNIYTKKCITVPGIINIGSYFRGVDFAFHLKNEFKRFDIKEGDAFYYARFHTNHRIKLKRFMFTPKLVDYQTYVWNIKVNRIPKFKSLDYFYKFFKKFNYKKHILKEIKKNLI